MDGWRDHQSGPRPIRSNPARAPNVQSFGPHQRFTSGTPPRHQLFGQQGVDYNSTSDEFHGRNDVTGLSTPRFFNKQIHRGPISVPNFPPPPAPHTQPVGPPPPGPPPPGPPPPGPPPLGPRPPGQPPSRPPLHRPLPPGPPPPMGVPLPHGPPPPMGVPSPHGPPRPFQMPVHFRQPPPFMNSPNQQLMNTPLPFPPTPISHQTIYGSMTKTTEDTQEINSQNKVNSTKSTILYEDEGQRSKDQKWVDDWLSRKPRQPKTKSLHQSTINVPEARQLMAEAINLRQSLNNIIMETQAGLMEEDDIGVVMATVTNIQQRLQEIKNMLQEEYIVALSQKLDKIKKKRRRLRSLQEKKADEKQQCLVMQEEKKKQLDEWKVSLQQKMEEQKKEKEVSAEADRILATVRRKLTDMNRSQQLLSALNRLREVRLEHSQNRGQSIPPEAEENYVDRMSHLVSLLQKQEKTYKEEEKALQVMLEVEQEEEKQRKQHLENRRIHSRAKTYSRKLESQLFGQQEAYHVLDSFSQYYQQAEHSIDSCIQIRKEWDMYCVPEAAPGNHLPMGWVLPSPPSSAVWASALPDHNV